MNGKPVILGGTPIVINAPESLFKWPIITKEDEDAALDVLRRGAMSGTDVTRQFEAEFKTWQGRAYGLGYNNGTGALLGALWACDVGIGDEVICPSLTYWASAIPVFDLGATVVFADCDPETLCISPDDIEHRITKRTKAIMVVHYLGHPCEMDKILEIGKKHKVKVIEDFSHAQGGLYKGKKVGSWGDVAASSLMSGKSFAIGEAGILVTDDKLIYEKAMAFGHYERSGELTDEWLVSYAGLPMGGYKHRMHQISAAVGRVQLKYYDARAQEIRDAVNYFWSKLAAAGVKCLRAHRIDASLGNMSGWYVPYGHYDPDANGGLHISHVLAAIKAEGIEVAAGGNKPLHTHPLFHTADIFGHGKPTRIANSDWDVRTGDASLPITEAVGERLLSVPYFKKLNKEWIDKYAEAYIRVLTATDEIKKLNLETVDVGGWHLSSKVSPERAGSK